MLQCRCVTGINRGGELVLVAFASPDLGDTIPEVQDVVAGRRSFANSKADNLAPTPLNVASPTPVGLVRKPTRTLPIKTF